MNRIFIGETNLDVSLFLELGYSFSLFLSNLTAIIIKTEPSVNWPLIPLERKTEPESAVGREHNREYALLTIDELQRINQVFPLVKGLLDHQRNFEN